MQGSNTEDPYTGLANAIILQAVKDYRDALKKLSRGRANKDAEIKKQEILNFFRSDWFGVLTEIDPEMLIRKLDEEV
ncbi:hypothetical protein [Clostridium cellulovorans]|uniref:Uncharacterized protein n=1 Tax=Clostridium cellulovorans (strain ATCC 35296 / DSM 3052 / OCM 3 / 743B) TaxID=573061 RepID=D9SLL8_CLOC7|nr:hypothetical protein [Clostridium cellulovorans]ADL53655.1 hypothetical protein Clocel_3992 [Clostridium cellulovorans 743B]